MSPPADSDARRLTLLFWSEGRSFSVELQPGEELTVGRGKDATVRLKDERLAAVHLTVKVQDRDGAQVSVVPPAGGVQLNEVQFSGSARMRVGDQLNVGRTAIILQSFSAPRPARPAPVRNRREFTERLEEEAARAQGTGRRLLFALARVRSSKGLKADAWAGWRAALKAGGLLGELGAETAQVLLVDPSPEEAQGLLERLGRSVRGEKAQVGHAWYPEDGLDAEALIEVALARLTGRDEDALPADALGALHDAGEEPLFVDPVMVRVVSVLDELSPLATPLLLRGERGVGKELLGALVHRRSGRDGALVKVDAGALRARELEVELFGAEDGKRSRPGALERAGRGTLLVTHADRMPAQTQAALARAVESQSATRMGGGKSVRLNARLVVTWQQAEPGTAQHPLERFVESSVQLPPLRDRTAEILPLAEHFLSRCRKRHGRPRLVLGEEAKPALLAADWPGNLRQLHNAIEAAVLVSESDEIRPADLPPEVAEEAEDPRGARGSDFRSSLKAVEKDVLLKALASTRWNVSRAAKELGLPRRTVVYRMARLGLRRPVR